MSQRREKNKSSALEWQYKLFDTFYMHRSFTCGIKLTSETFMGKLKDIEALEGFDPTRYYINTSLLSPTAFQLRIIRGYRQEEVAYIEGYLENADTLLTLNATVFPGKSGISYFVIAIVASPFALILLMTVIVLVRDIAQISSQTGFLFLVSLVITTIVVGACAGIAFDRNEAYLGFTKFLEDINHF